MIRFVTQNIIRFILLIAAQVLIFNHINFSQFINPYVYILFIILLPFETPNGITLVSAFLLGIIIDMFTNTLGMHAAATVFIAFLRPYVLNYLSPRDGYEVGTTPRVIHYGLSWFVKYVVVLVIAHHLVLFYLEIFGFSNFFSTFFRVLASSLFSATFIVLSQFFVFRQ